MKHRGFVIAPKRDFGSTGYFIDGKYVKKGYLVLDGKGTCNILPGATWFKTVKEAKSGIDTYIAVGGTPNGESSEDTGKLFWLLNRVQNIVQKAKSRKECLKPTTSVCATGGNLGTLKTRKLPHFAANLLNSCLQFASTSDHAVRLEMDAADTLNCID